MKRLLLILPSMLIIFVCQTMAYASATSNENLKGSFNNQALKIEGTALSDIVSDDWNVLVSKKVDLNRDGIDDLVFVIQDTDKSKIEVKDWGESDINPRLLTIYIGTKLGYKQHSVVADFIPVKDSPNLLEPFDSESDALQVNDKGVIALNFLYFMSAGGWSMSSEEYKFQFKNKDFELIGYDYFSRHRATTEITAYSVNFLTHEMSKSHYYDDPKEEEASLEDGNKLFEDEFRDFELDQPFTLSNINDFDFPVLDIFFESRHYPKASGKVVSDFIPSNWKILKKETGDLNQDGITDIVMVIQDTNDKVISENYNSNPSLLAIYLGSSEGFNKQVIYPDHEFINYDVKITPKGLLVLEDLNDYVSRGNNIKETITYKFQLQKSYNSQVFILVGLETKKVIDNTKSKSLETLSVNFQTHKAIHNLNGHKDTFIFRLDHPLSLNSEVGYTLSNNSHIETLKKWQIK